MTSNTDDDVSPEAQAQLPSKSARKRDALAAQRLGEELIGLDDAELVRLALPEPLQEAIREARRIVSRSASARQRQYIGRLMRDIDLAAVRAALEARRLVTAHAAQRFRQLESWRERLLADPAALAELARTHPSLEPVVWQRAIAAARAERERGAAGGAQRTLFRMLRTLTGEDAG